MKHYSAHSLFSLAQRPQFKGSFFRSEKCFKLARSVWIGSLLRHQLHTDEEPPGGSEKCTAEGLGALGE